MKNYGSRYNELFMSLFVDDRSFHRLILKTELVTYTKSRKKKHGNS